MSLRYLLRGQMKFMASQGIEVHMASANGQEVEEVSKYEGCPHHIFNLTRSITPITDVITIVKLVRFLKKEKYDIVHSHTPKAGLIAMLASRLAGVRNRLHTVAGIPWMEANGAKRVLLKQVDKLAYSCATEVYPNSFELKKFMLKEKLVAPKKLKVLGNGSSNGIDTSFFCPSSVPESKKELRARYEVPKDKFVFVFVGRVVKDKGIEDLYNAFKTLSDQCHLVLVGPFEQELDPISEEAINFFKASGNVSLMGYQNDVRPFLKLADALVLPSYREGFPNVPMQSGAMGIPSIVSNINGCNEIVVHGQNGLIVPVKDSKSLNESMNLLIQDADLYRSLKGNSRKMITDRYDQKIMWKNILNEYCRLNHNV